MQIKQVQSEAGKALESALKNLQNKVCKVGWIDKSKYPRRELKRAHTVLKHLYAYKILGIVHEPPNVAFIAAQNELGNPNKKIPARPFLRPTVVRDSNIWKKIGLDGSKKVLKNQLKIEDVLDAIGSKAASGIIRSIRKVYSPSLAESTILARISRSSTLKKIKGKINISSLGNVTKPLIDTGLMLATVAYKVENE